MTSGFQLAGIQAERYEQHTAAFMGPSARLIVASSALDDGDSVLDLVCGTGLIARFASTVVFPKGRVAGVDLNPTGTGTYRVPFHSHHLTARKR